MLVSILIVLAETSSVAASLAIMNVNYKLSHCFTFIIIYKKFFPIFVILTVLNIINFFLVVNP